MIRETTLHPPPVTIHGAASQLPVSRLLQPRWSSLVVAAPAVCFARARVCRWRATSVRRGARREALSLHLSQVAQKPGGRDRELTRSRSGDQLQSRASRQSLCDITPRGGAPLAHRRDAHVPLVCVMGFVCPVPPSSGTRLIDMTSSST